MTRLIDADVLLQKLNKNDVPFNADVNQAILDAPTVNQWIKCSDRMPRDGQWAIWVFNDGYIDVARYKFDAIPHFFPPTKSRYILEDAVAWMPLPKPYEEE